MADVVRKVEYFSIQVPNAPAKAFGVLSTLVSSRVDLLACIGVQRGRRAQIDVVPADTRKFKSAVKKAELEFEPRKQGFLIQGTDRTGALTDHLKKLGESGINVTGIDALSAGQGRWGAIIWVATDAVAKAARVLGASAAKRTPSEARQPKNASRASGASAAKRPRRKVRQPRRR